MKLAAALCVLALACERVVVLASPDLLGEDDLCAAEAGRSPCAPNAVCVEVPRSHILGCTCCTCGPGTSATINFDVAYEADATLCARIAAGWALVCPALDGGLP